MSQGAALHHSTRAANKNVFTLNSYACVLAWLVPINTFCEHYTDKIIWKRLTEKKNLRGGMLSAQGFAWDWLLLYKTLVQ